MVSLQNDSKSYLPYMLITWTVEFRLYEGKLQKEDKTLQINHVFIRFYDN